MKDVFAILKDSAHWEAPVYDLAIPQGDMPGDKIEINQGHKDKASIIFKELIKLLPEVLAGNEKHKAVLAVCGGSGVGKSETASLISCYLRDLGIGSYTLSGDNYPHRIPVYNDAERLRVFRNGGVHALVEAGLMNPQTAKEMIALQEQELDADWKQTEIYPWFACYMEGALVGLKSYLGTETEIDFPRLTDIVKQFKDGAEQIYLKRMGRTDAALWYEKVDFSQVSVLVIEWTHGNSDNYQGVDIPILLNSTPEETLAHRLSRNRDGKPDSPFIMRVLELEQQMIHSQAHKAKIIVSKACELLTYEEYCSVMK